jgi:hypothetical protein
VTVGRVEPGAAVAAGRRLRTGALSSVVRLTQIRPLYVLGSLVAVEWLTTLALALTVRHNGWLYYQGGDQVWSYTTSWLLQHGQLPLTPVGYGESVLLMPFTFFGANLLHILPAIVLLNVLFLMPVALLAMYGIGERIGGRLFGYWVAFLWIVLPFIGIKYTDAGFHQRYTETTLPQALGLTGMSDFPSMVMLAVSAYFLVRVLQSRAWLDGFLAGTFAGFAIGIKPSSALYLGGVIIAVLASRRWRAGLALAAGLAPSLLALTVWKWRGLGYLPIFRAEPGSRVAMGPAAVQLPGRLGQYIPLSWSHFATNFGSLQEHFWSARVVEWLVLAGIVGLARRSWPACCFAGGWFMVFFIIKGSSPQGNLEDASLLRMLIPAIPAFVLLMAALPFLLPGIPQRAKPTPIRSWGTPRLRLTLAIAATMLFAAVPIGLAGIARPVGGGATDYYSGSAGPVPATLPVDLTVHGTRVRMTWPSAKPGSARVFYDVSRALPTCLAKTSNVPGPSGRDSCLIAIAHIRTPTWTETLSPGQYGYRITESANWLDDPTTSDPYLATRWISIRIR